MKITGRIFERSRKSLPFGASLGVLLLASMIELTGCSGSQPSSAADAKPTQTMTGTDKVADLGTGKSTDTGNGTTPLVQNTASPAQNTASPAQNTASPAQTTTAQNTQTPPNAAGFVLTGTFLLPNCDALNYGEAVVTQTGPNHYHLLVSTSHGYSHNNGNIKSDFTYDGKRFVLSDAQYAQVTLSFTDHSITIDYPGDGFGGANAEPKGTYYLSNSEDGNGAFLSKLYDSLKLDDSDRHGDVDVNTYPIGDQDLQKGQELLLVQGKSDAGSSLNVPNSLVVYDTSNQTFNDLGEISDTTLKDLHSKLEALKVDPNTIYKVLHTDFYDRFIQLKMDKFDAGTLDLNHLSLTDAEAFYIVTGQKGVTKVSRNNRNAQNIGSIYTTEVDHSDGKSVTIHQYESVRNSATDTHNATHDWYEVDRATGEVKSLLFE